MWITEADLPHYYDGNKLVPVVDTQVRRQVGFALQAFFNEIDAQFWRDMYWDQMKRDIRKSK